MHQTSSYQAAANLIFGLMLSLCLSGCAQFKGIPSSPFAPKPTIVAPSDNLQFSTNWSNYAPDELPLTDWVASFEDPVLTELVNEALQENRNVKAAYSRLLASGAQLKISKADKKPLITGRFQGSRNQRGNDIFPSSNNFNANATISWEWDLWGRVRDRIASSELDFEANKADLASINLSVAGQVTQNWFNLIEATLLSEISNRDVMIRNRLLHLTEIRHEGGIARSSDVRLASSALINAEETRFRRKQVLANTSRSLEVLLSRYPSKEIEAAKKLPNLPGLSGAGNPKYILARRPDLLAAESRLLAQGLQIDEARRALRPNLTFSANPGLLGTSLANTFDPSAFAATVAASLIQPIYQGGRLKANVEQQENLLQSQLEEYANIALIAFLEVESALETENSLVERERTLLEFLESANNAETRLESRHAKGLVTQLELLDAQSRILTAQGQLISIQVDRLINRVQLHVALGGGIYGEK